METLKADLATLNGIVSHLTQDLKNTIESEVDGFNAGRIEELQDSFSFAKLSNGVKKRISVLLPKVPTELHSPSNENPEDSDNQERSDDDIVKREESSIYGDVEGDDDRRGENQEDGEDEDGEGGSSFYGNKSRNPQTSLKTATRRVTLRRSMSLKPPNLNEQTNSTAHSAGILDGELTNVGNSGTIKEQAMAVWRAVNQHKYAVVFRKPVSLKDAPGYVKVVKEPMDLSLIKTKIETGKVKQFDELGRLFDLMCENAMKYNGKGDDYYAYAKELKTHSRAAVRAVKNTAAQIVRSPSQTRLASKRKRTETSEGEEEHEETPQEEGGDQGATTTRRKRAEAGATAAITTTPTPTAQPLRLSERSRRRK